MEAEQKPTFNPSEHCTEIFWKNASSHKRFVFNQGGTRSSKTYSLVQLAWIIASQNNRKVISIVSETMPHLKKGAMRDFFIFLETFGLYEPKSHNRTDNIYKVGSSMIEFFSADSSDKVHGPGRDYLFANEIQNLTFETFFHLAQRTNVQIFADYNPTHAFWVYSKFLDEPEYRKHIDYIHSTIFDNRFVSEAIKNDVLIRAKNDANYRRVYLEGEPGTLEGLVFETFEIIENFPEGLNTVYGLDFGFTADPTALIKIAIKGESLYLQEIIYRTDLRNTDIIRLMVENRIRPNYDEITADSAEPKSVREIELAGFNIKGAEKGPDSVRNGIDNMKRFKIRVTKASVNLIKEFRNYSWITDRDGNATNKPSDIFNHGIDAARYGLQALTKPNQTDYFL